MSFKNDFQIVNFVKQISIPKSEFQKMNLTFQKLNLTFQKVNLKKDFENVNFVN